MAPKELSDVILRAYWFGADLRSAGVARDKVIRSVFPLEGRIALAITDGWNDRNAESTDPAEPIDLIHEILEVARCRG